MKSLIFILIFSIPAIAYSQASSQSESERILKSLEKHYKRQFHTPFPGVIKVTSRDTILYDNLYIKVTEVDDSLMPMFDQGIIYPGLFDSPVGVKVLHLYELKQPANTFKTKLYALRIMEHLVMEPQVYVVELTNSAANANTDLQTFLKGATLSFIRRMWFEV